VPVIELETERLRLRAWRDEDAEVFAVMNADAEVMRHIGDGRPLRRRDSDALLDMVRRHWDEHGFGLWAVEPRDGEAVSGGLVGFAGLAVPSFLPVVLPAVEVGWRLPRPWWGRGYATEAASASVAHGFGALGLASVISIIDPRNARSLRVAEKLGMRDGRGALHPRTGRRLRVLELSARAAEPISAQGAASSPRGG